MTIVVPSSESSENFTNCSSFNSSSILLCSSVKTPSTISCPLLWAALFTVSARLVTAPDSSSAEASITVLIPSFTFSTALPIASLIFSSAMAAAASVSIPTAPDTLMLHVSLVLTTTTFKPLLIMSKSTADSAAASASCSTACTSWYGTKPMVAACTASPAAIAVLRISLSVKAKIQLKAKRIA